MVYRKRACFLQPRPAALRVFLYLITIIIGISHMMTYSRSQYGSGLYWGDPQTDTNKESPLAGLFILKGTRGFQCD